MMVNLIFKNLFLSDAKEILELCYNTDRSGGYSNDFCFAGTHLTAIISQIEKDSKDSVKEKFAVNVKSSFLNEYSLKELFDEYVYAL